MKPSFRFLVTVGIVLLLVALDRLLDAPFVNQRIVLLLVYVSINVIMAVSLNLINGFTGQFSLGHAGFMAVGAYVAASVTTFGGPLWHHWTGFLPVDLSNTMLFLGALGIGGTAAAVAGLVVGIPTLRLRGDYLAIATLGFGEIIRIIILNLNIVGGARGMIGIPQYTTVFWVCLLMLGAIILVRNIGISLHGRAMLAVREDEFAAASIGVNTTYYKVLAFCIGAFLAGIAGGLMAHFISFISPDSFDFLKSVEAVVMVVLGGMGSITGSVVAAIALTLLREFLRVAGAYRLVLYALLLIVMMLLRPQGLMGTTELSWERLRSWRRGGRRANT